MLCSRLCTLCCCMSVVLGFVKANDTLYPLLTPPTYNTSFIIKTFVELQNQWCPPRRFKKFYILNFNQHPFSEEILTAILKFNDPPKILSSEGTGVTYWTYQHRRCAIIMATGIERLKSSARAIYYGSRYFIFHPKLTQNFFMDDLAKGASVIMDKAYHILYNQTHVEILHRNFFSHQTIALDPHNIRVPDDLQNLHGRRLQLAVRQGINEMATFDDYLGRVIADRRNATFELVPSVHIHTDYFIENVGMPLHGTDQVVALGSMYMSVLVPRSKPKPIIMVLVDPFDYYCWLMIFVTIFSMALLLSLFGSYLRKFNIVVVALELMMCILAGPSLTYGGWLENNLITLLCLLTIAIVSSYQSLIISNLSSVRYYPEINSVQEIRNACVFPLHDTLARMCDFENLPSSNVDPLAIPNLCFLYPSRDSRTMAALQLNYTRKTQDIPAMYYAKNLRIAKEGVHSFQMLYYFTQKSLIRELFPFFMSAFAESGLFDHYYRNLSTLAMDEKYETFINRSFNVEDLLVVWCLYLGGISVSFGWFMMEIVAHWGSKVPGKLFDKWKKRTIFRKGICIRDTKKEDQ